jgi:ribonuclease P protein component
MTGRLVHKADFERLLATRWRSRSAHFALHHVIGEPAPPLWKHKPLSSGELSTVAEQLVTGPVDNNDVAQWLGCLVPKRHARRSVTRSLLKRQIRAGFLRHADFLPGGLWLVRLKAGFAKEQFVSAASPRLAQAVRAEIDGLLAPLCHQPA